MGDITKDSRFSHISKDPRFKTIPRSHGRVKIDKRFQSMFDDKRFKIKYSVDKRGRPVAQTSQENLKRYYDLASDSSELEDESIADDADKSVKHGMDIKISKSLMRRKDKSDTSSDSSDDDDEDDIMPEGTEEQEEVVNELKSDDEQLSDKIKTKLHDLSVDYARGEGVIVSDSSSDEESSEDDADTIEHGWGELDKDADKTDELSSRLAVCNMDWDRIRAVDLMVVLNSFAPPGGIVRSVVIYPSEFGLERMKKEEKEGPSELVHQGSKRRDLSYKDENVDGQQDIIDAGSDSDTAVVENDESSKFHIEKLRQYQLNRLKYYYAIVECDSINTANHIYTECDGMEYESSASRLDLRFVPDGTTFDQEPREICSDMPDASKYRPRYFTTTALQQAKVNLTWDETDPTRAEIADRLRVGDDVEEKDLQAYLASSSGDDSAEEEENTPQAVKKVPRNVKSTEATDDQSVQSTDEEGEKEDSIAKYRSLLIGLEEEDEKKKSGKDVHLEISWSLGLKEKTAEAVKKRLSTAKELTPFQEMIEKRKQKHLAKKKEKLQKKKELDEDNDNNEENLFSDDDIPSDIDMNDPYFAEEFKDHKSGPKKKSKTSKEHGETEENLQKKAELELLLLDKDEPKHFNFKKIQKDDESKKTKKSKRVKRKERLAKDTTEDDFNIDVDDKRFSALYSSHLYNIDPTDSHFRKSQAMDALISAKQKRLADSSTEKPDPALKAPPVKKSKKDVELSLLVKSVKSKAQRQRSN